MFRILTVPDGTVLYRNVPNKTVPRTCWTVPVPYCTEPYQTVPYQPVPVLYQTIPNRIVPTKPYWLLNYTYLSGDSEITICGLGIIGSLKKINYYYVSILYRTDTILNRRVPVPDRRVPVSNQTVLNRRYPHKPYGTNTYRTGTVPNRTVPFLLSWL